METNIEKYIEKSLPKKQKTQVRLYNPDCMDFKRELRIKSIEATNEYTRIDFIYRSSSVFINGGWINMDAGAYIQPVDCNTKYGLIKAIEIPLAPKKHFFFRQGEIYPYTLIFPALPKNTYQINIIEKEAPGNYINFYGVDYSKWMTLPHAAELPITNN